MQILRRPGKIGTLQNDTLPGDRVIQRTGCRKGRLRMAGVSFRPSTFDLRPLFRIGGDSGELVERHVAAGWRSGFEQTFDAAHGFRREQNVATNIADLCGNVVDHDHLTPVFDGVDDCPGFIDAGASGNGAFHGWLFLSRGVNHFGGRRKTPRPCPWLLTFIPLWVDRGMGKRLDSVPTPSFRPPKGES